MIIPPLVYVSILEANILIPADLIPLLSNKFQEFDRTSPSVKACTILQAVLEYLWAAHHKKIPSTVVGVDNSQEALSWSNRLHSAHILPSGPPPFLPPPSPVPGLPQDQSVVNSIVGELHLLRDAQDKQHLREITMEEDKKKSNEQLGKVPGRNPINDPSHDSNY